MSLRPGTVRLDTASAGAETRDGSTSTAVGAHGIEGCPPPEVRAQVAAAAERAAVMAAQGRELHFATDPVSGRLVVQVRDLAGGVVRTIKPSEALDLMTG